MNNFDWRWSDHCFSLRSTLLSSLIRSKVELVYYVYEFCDFVISQGYTASECIEELDADVMSLYNEWLNNVKFYGAQNV